MQLIFATNNKNKLKELQLALKSDIELISLKDIGFSEEIPEDFETLQENAIQKAEYISSRFEGNCFADDTGLEIEALNGAPGVYSARYAGESRSSKKNMAKVIQELEGLQNRKARFRTVIALILNGHQHLFEGICEGEILQKESGTDGFGYDPIFKPNGFKISFAEMTMEQKNEISHRGKAVQKLVSFLNNLGQ